MKSLVVCLMSLLVFVQAGAAQQATVAGRVRLMGGLPVAEAQVLLFDLGDLRRGVLAQATTDADGLFVLPLAALGGQAVPQDFMLGQNYPNPFNPATIIPYQLPTSGHVRLDVFNVLGQRVATLVDAERPAGFHTVRWAATDAAGQAVAAGVYIYRLRSAGVELTRRMVLIDGQAGTAAPVLPAPAAMPPEATERTYGLVISGEGTATYVDAAFGVRAGMAPVELVVDAVAGLPRGKALAGGIWGDVNNDGRVDVNDALLLAMYNLNSSITLPNNGNMSLGDINGDGQVNLADALAIMTYAANPSDASLPARIGQAVASGKSVAESVRRLTYNGGESPAWSPDGQQIAFESSSGEIYVMDADGDNQRPLRYSAYGRYPAWSPDGQQIAYGFFTVGEYWQIYVMDADGDNQRRLYYTENDTGGFPAWSPDGQQIAYVSDGGFGRGGIRVSDTDRDIRPPLINFGWSPAWSPDGQQIAFTAASDDDATFQIYVIDADGDNLRRLTKFKRRSGLLNFLSPAWSPDGQQIAFRGVFFDEEVMEVKSGIYVMNADGDGSNAHLLTYVTPYIIGRWTWVNDYPLPFDNGTLTWSPDGQQIAFDAFDDDLMGRDIYVVEVQPPSAGLLTIPPITLTVGSSYEYSITKAKDFPPGQYADYGATSNNSAIVAVEGRAYDPSVGLPMALVHIEGKALGTAEVTLSSNYGDAQTIPVEVVERPPSIDSVQPGEAKTENITLVFYEPKGVLDPIEEKIPWFFSDLRLGLGAIDLFLEYLGFGSTEIETLPAPITWVAYEHSQTTAYAVSEQPVSVYHSTSGLLTEAFVTLQEAKQNVLQDIILSLAPGWLVWPATAKSVVGDIQMYASILDIILAVERDESTKAELIGILADDGSIIPGNSYLPLLMMKNDATNNAAVFELRLQVTQDIAIASAEVTIRSHETIDFGPFTVSAKTGYQILSNHILTFTEAAGRDLKRVELELQTDGYDQNKVYSVRARGPALAVEEVWASASMLDGARTEGAFEVGPNDQFTLWTKVLNRSETYATSAAAPLRYYCSSDPVIDPSDDFALEQLVVEVEPLAGLGETQKTIRLPAPRLLADRTGTEVPGTCWVSDLSQPVYYGACVWDEVEEEYNACSWGVPVEVSGL